MAIRKDKIVIIDMEATCWEGFDAPPGQENEIIEIGVCLLEPRSRTISDLRSILIKPTESVVSEFCTELTTLTQEMVDEKGITFEAACKILEREYDSRNRMWSSWGTWDLNFLKKQCKRRDVRYPLSRKHTNLKRLFSDHYGQRLNFADALAGAGLSQDGTPHRGGDDAHNSARLLDWLLSEYGLKIIRRYGF